MKTASVNATCRAAMVAALCFVVAACSATGYSITELAANINATLDTGPRVAVPGDTIRASFPENRDWTHEARVRPDGKAVFQAIDEVEVAGLTAKQLDEKLTQLYGPLNLKSLSIDILPAPDAADTPADAAFVIGEVQRPGPVALVGRTWTLTEAIGAAGGHLKATANLRNTILVRRLASGEMRSWRLDADLYRWGDHPPIWLQPRDIVFVPNTAIDEVDIWVDKYIRQMIPLPALFPAP
jgi:protein involved in polysaccharide export with SLBB domain